LALEAKLAISHWHGKLAVSASFSIFGVTMNLKTPNFRRSALARSAMLACSAMAAVLAAPQAVAQDAQLQRVEITGSSIKRVAAEGALPVQTITKTDIVRSGATSVSELMQQLPTMQGFTTSGESVGGAGGGTMTASLHDIGESYTLVLLNGRRLAPRGSGSTVDLNSIPLSAIERVEVLTDGASALYGSDAIAGVVNFILKKDQQSTQATIRYNNPQKAGGDSYNASVSTGFGDLEKDGYNILMAFSKDHNDRLKAADRDFAKTGMIGFKHEGKDLYYFNGSGNAIPGNANVRYVDAAGATKTVTLNPYLKANGQCAPSNSQIGNECWFDYTSTIEIQPESDRNSFFGRAAVKLGSDWTGTLDAARTNYKMTTRIAAYPTGWFNLPMASPLVAQYVTPYLTAEQLAGMNRVQARWRSDPAGGRETLWDTTSTHLVAGLEGAAAGWDISGAFTYSVNDTKQDYTNGWLLADEFLAAAGSGAFNVFTTGDKFTDADKAALAGTVYHGPWDREKTTLTGIEARGSRPVFKVGGGDAMLGVGVDLRNYKYSRTVSDTNAAEKILFLGKDDPYGLKRQNFGFFGELVVPVTKELELTGALRYDRIGKVVDTAAGVDINDDEADTTYKFSARYQPSKSLLFRGSLGTGFKAPSMLEIGKPRGDFGVTGDRYACPFTAPDPLAAACLPGLTQVNVFTQGNPALRPEKSKQRSIGFVFEPTKTLTMGMDLWEVKINDLVTELTDQQIFDDPVRYRELFTTKKNLATGDQELAILRAAVNASKSVNRGIDWRLGWDTKLSFGNLKTTVAGTHLLESKYTRPGTDIYVTSLGKYGENGAVSFRDVFQVTGSLQTGAFTNTLTAKYRSGYKDQEQSADNCAITLGDALGDCVDVLNWRIPAYTTFDWQIAYVVNKTLEIRGGINNLFDKKPHLSIGDGGGHQVGYDPRYTDSFGRTFYITADLKF
jgi:iron complex outermembrane receptor protein